MEVIGLKTPKDDFILVGINNEGENFKKPILNKEKKPYISFIIIAIICFGCMLSHFIPNLNASYMNISQINMTPCSEFLFGTDSMGRDIFKMIWYGGGISLFIGIFSTIISTSIGVIYGSISGISSQTINAITMRFAEILLSIPSILIIVFVQAIAGNATVLSMSIVIGITSWIPISKIVQEETRRIWKNDYVVAASFFGGSFFYILRRHLAPNFIPAIMFMVVTNIGSAIAIESTLSFLGIGLPIEVISWGSMLSLSEKALLSNYWWIILIPGLFLVTTLMCITNIGDYIKRKNTKMYANI